VVPRLGVYAHELNRVEELFSINNKDGTPKTAAEIAVDRAKAERLAGSVKRQFSEGLTPHQVEQRIAGLEGRLARGHELSPELAKHLVKELNYWGERSGRDFKVQAGTITRLPEQIRRQLAQADKRIELTGNQVDLAKDRYWLDREKFDWQKSQAAAKNAAAKNKAAGKGVTGNKMLAPYEQHYESAFQSFHEWEKKNSVFAGALRAVEEGKPIPEGLEATVATPMFARGKILLDDLNKAREAWLKAYDRMGISTEGLPRLNPETGKVAYPGQPGYQQPQINIYNVPPGAAAPGGGGGAASPSGAPGGAPTGGNKPQMSHAEFYRNQVIEQIMAAKGVDRPTATRIYDQTAAELKAGKGAPQKGPPKKGPPTKKVPPPRKRPMPAKPALADLKGY
ncbi:MAG TPA: hypothetical protein VFR31_03175, partial [Thermoanaerobaculia bacterium]|nr:hypothetical protein [Thermoanaerobaculia bacterium]